MKMAELLSPKRVGLSVMFVSGIAYIVCAIFVALSLGGTVRFFNYLFHGIDLEKITTTGITFQATLIGFVEAIVLAFIIGWLFAVVYNNLKGV